MSGILSTAAEQARAMVGHRYRCASPFRVERARIREFARAVQAYHPAHWQEAAAARLGFDAVVAPPTFAAVVWQQARREILERLITGYRLDRVVHVDQTLDIGRPLLAGDVLDCDIYFESFRHFHTFDVITVTCVLTDQHGTPVQTGSAALLASTVDVADQPGARTATAENADTLVTLAVRHLRRPRTRVDFDQLTVHAELPTAGASLTARDLTNYARALGDPSPDGCSADDRSAVVAPDMLVLSLASGYLTSWTRDPAAVTKYRVEFANQVHYLAVPPSEAAEIEFTGRVLSCDRRARTATVAIDAISQGRKLFGYATAEVCFAPSRDRRRTAR